MARIESVLELCALEFQLRGRRLPLPSDPLREVHEHSGIVPRDCYYYMQVICSRLCQSSIS